MLAQSVFAPPAPFSASASTRIDGLGARRPHEDAALAVPSSAFSRSTSATTAGSELARGRRGRSPSPAESAA